jgi:hypothetical protein
MLRPVMGLAAAGVASLILWKLFVFLLLPLFGIAIGLVVTVVKFAFLAGLILFAIWIFRRCNRESTPA